MKETTESPKLLSRFGHFFLILGLLALAVVACLWYSNQTLRKKLSQQEIKTPQITVSPPEAEDYLLKELEKQEESDEIDEIEKDLHSTNLEDLDQELSRIDEELSLP